MQPEKGRIVRPFLFTGSLMAYVTVDEFRAWFGVPNENDDPQIEHAIAAATRWFENMTGRVFEAATDTTVTFDAERDVAGDSLIFYDLDLCQVTSVVNGDGQFIQANQYVTEPRRHAPFFEIRLKLETEHAWTYEDTPEDAISVTGRWAYSLPPPADVKQAVMDVANSYYRQRDNMTEAV